MPGKTARGSCGAARGAFLEASPAAPPAAGIALASGVAVSAFGWCCVPPLFADSVLCCSDLCHSGYSDSGGGAGETSPATPRAAPRFAILALPGGDIRSGGLERSCGAVRGTIIETTPAAPTATGITLATGMTISAFGWCCVPPTFFSPFFWFRREAGRCVGTSVPVVFRKCLPIRVSGFAGRGEGSS